MESPVSMVVVEQEAKGPPATRAGGRAGVQTMLVYIISCLRHCFVVVLIRIQKFLNVFRHSSRVSTLNSVTICEEPIPIEGLPRAVGNRSPEVLFHWQ